METRFRVHGMSACLIAVSAAATEKRMQLRADKFNGDRSNCLRCCPKRSHRHGSYERYEQPTGR